MATYTLLGGVTVNYATPPIPVAVPGSAGTSQTPAVNWLHHAWIVSGGATCSATVTAMGSNDDRVSLGAGGNGLWIAAATPVTVTATATAGNTGQATINGILPFKYHGTAVSITGAGAAVTDVFSA